MPASYVHQCVAKDSCDALHLFEEEQLRAALLAGSEGPDPRFFSLSPAWRSSSRKGSYSASIAQSGALTVAFFISCFTNVIIVRSLLSCCSAPIVAGRQSNKRDTMQNLSI